MLSLRARIFIIISLIIFVILGISIFLFVRSKKQAALKDQAATEASTPSEPQVAGDLPEVAPITVTEISNDILVNPASSLETQQKAVQQISKIFTERFNSYSSESQYQNVRDVESLVSETYWNELSAKLPSSKTVQNTVIPFSSTIVKAYSSKLVGWDEESALVELQVKITEEKNGVVANRDQQAKVRLIKDGQNWLVDKFEWVK